MGANARGAGRSLVPAAIVAGAAMLVFIAPTVSAAAFDQGPSPAFPREVASYSWFTPMLSSARLDAAVVLYQNGVGVEFLDSPQSVVIGTDGTSYRRFDEAEHRSIPEDQGDPAEAVLSPDGTFAVLAGEDRGSIDVVALRDGSRWSVPLDAGVAAVPVAVAGDGGSVLLLTSAQNLSPYTDAAFRLNGDLARLDLRTGALERFPTGSAVNAAAPSPDGSRILADTEEGFVLIDTADGAVTNTGISSRHTDLDGDAWSPDGEHVAVLAGDTLRVLEVDGATATERAVPLEGIEYGSVIGWRDPSTVLVHSGSSDGANDSWFSWVDVASGDVDRFSSYRPDFTGASLANPDAARDLVPQWQVEERPVDRAAIPYVFAAIGAAALGLLAWALTPRRR